jgi:hypothetical protein
MGEKKYVFWEEEPDGKNHLEDLDEDGRIILK